MIKGVVDMLLAAIAVVVLAPFLIFIAIAIKLASKGPVFYTQRRCGLNGRIFDVYKFRTMIVGADKQTGALRELNEADGPVFKIKNDPRIIPRVGSFLRRTSLDELPQLINVLKGQMSFIGPRPPIPHEVEQYSIWQRRRLSMKPGMSCLWQISPNRHDMSFDQWMNLDLKYIDNWSLGLDLRIFFKTIWVVLRGRSQ